ncbi:MAG TPA: hypothetical protein ACN46K_07360, partial [Prochlorococcus sp.]
LLALQRAAHRNWIGGTSWTRGHQVLQKEQRPRVDPIPKGKTVASASAGLKTSSTDARASAKDCYLLSLAGRVPVGFRQLLTIQQQAQPSCSMS